MKIISRDFTPREKFLLVILSLLIIGLLYYNFVDVPVRKQMNSLQAEKESLTEQLEVLDNQITSIEHMQKEIDRMKSAGEVISKMPSYNAGKREVNFLHTTLGESQDYYIGFNELTRNSDQIRRNFSLQYVTSDFNQAIEVMRRLEQSNFRCMIGDMSVNPAVSRGNVMTDPVQVTCTATFYETMYGGKADAELPPDADAEE